MRASRLSLLFLSELPSYLHKQLVKLSFLKLHLSSLIHAFSPFLVLFLCCALHRVDFSLFNILFTPIHHKCTCFSVFQLKCVHFSMFDIHFTPIQLKYTYFSQFDWNVSISACLISVSLWFISNAPISAYFNWNVSISVYSIFVSLLFISNAPISAYFNWNVSISACLISISLQFIMRLT